MSTINILSKNIAIILISHRLILVKNCDKVFEIISKSIKEKKINLRSKVRVTSYQKI